jgi:hypothetical protein
VREQVLEVALVRGGAAERDQGPAHTGAREGHRGLERDRDAEVVKDGRQQRPRLAGAASYHDDFVGRHAVGEQVRDLEPDGLRLTPGAGALHQHDALVGLDRPGLCLEEVAVEVAKRRSWRVVLVERQLANDLPAELVAQHRQQGRPRCQRAAIGVVHGDGDVGLQRQRGEQLSLCPREVVEAVEADRSPAERLRVRAQGGDRRRHQGPGVTAAGGLAELHVRGVQVAKLALMARILEVGDHGRELVRGDQRRLQLGDQRVHGGGEARMARRPAQAPERRALDRRSHERLALGNSQGRSDERDAGSRDLVGERAEGRDRGAQGVGPAVAEVALEAGDVVARGDDEDRLGGRRLRQPVEDLASAARVRRADDQRDRHLELP